MIVLSREVSKSLCPARSGRLQKKSNKGPIRRRTLNRLSGTPLTGHFDKVLRSFEAYWWDCIGYMPEKGHLI